MQQSAATIAPTRAPTIEAIRARFSSLQCDDVLLENAGGSQVPDVVADAVRDHMLERYVQLGAGYPRSRAADSVVTDAHQFINLMMNGEGIGKTILGPSATQLITTLVECYRTRLKSGDEVIVMESGHESNIGPWMKLESSGVKLRMWKFDPESMQCPLDGLAPLLTDRTRIVAATHVSNLLGGIVDLAPIAKLAHDAGARLVVDGVAFAPHRAIDVQSSGADYYVYSTYKVYGPHMAAMFGRSDVLAEITGPNHFFIPADEVPYKFELGGVSHEGCAGLLALRTYLNFLSGHSADSEVSRSTIEAAFGLMTQLELPLQNRLLAFLITKKQVRIIGPNERDTGRVGTISFVHAHKSSREIVTAAHAAGIGIRHGHMYAHRLCTALGLDPEDGVVRVSLVHYNTIEEIDRLIQALDPLLD